jgi:uncharacterized phiE125 gp8 family phage protein
MTIAEMRALLQLAPEISDAEVVERYALYLGAASATPPVAVPPITLEAAKLHLKVDTNADDALIGDLLAAAVDHVERITGMFLSRRPFASYADGLGRWLELRPWPIKSIDGVVYAGVGGDFLLDPALYHVADGARPARIVPIATWPNGRSFRGSVTITGTAGFDGPEDVPPLALQAVRVLLAEFYQNREAGALSIAAERSVAWLLRDLKVRRL